MFGTRIPSGASASWSLDSRTTSCAVGGSGGRGGPPQHESRAVRRARAGTRSSSRPPRRFARARSAPAPSSCSSRNLRTRVEDQQRRALDDVHAPILPPSGRARLCSPAARSSRARAGTTAAGGSRTSSAGVVLAVDADGGVEEIVARRRRCRPGSAGSPTARCSSSRCATGACCAGRRRRRSRVHADLSRAVRLARERHGRRGRRQRVRRQLRLRPRPRASRARRRSCASTPTGRPRGPRTSCSSRTAASLTDDGRTLIVGRDVGRAADRVRRRRRRRARRIDGRSRRFRAPRRTAARSTPRAASGLPTRAATAAYASRGAARSATTVTRARRAALLRLHARRRRRPDAARSARPPSYDEDKPRDAVVLHDPRRSAARGQALAAGAKASISARQLRGRRTRTRARRSSMPAAPNCREPLALLLDGPSRKISRTSASGTSSTARGRSPALPRVDAAARARRRSRASGRTPCRPARSRRRRTSASRRRSASSPVEREEAAGELLLRRRRTRATTCATRLSGRKFVNAPSATRAASRSIGSRSAASTIGTGCAGGDGEPEAAVAALAREHGAQVRRPSPRPSRSGRSNGIPFQRSTITFDDAPSPSTKRPLLASAARRPSARAAPARA